MATPVINPVKETGGSKNNTKIESQNSKAFKRIVDNDHDFRPRSDQAQREPLKPLASTQAQTRNSTPSVDSLDSMEGGGQSPVGIVSSNRANVSARTGPLNEVSPNASAMAERADDEARKWLSLDSLNGAATNINHSDTSASSRGSSASPSIPVSNVNPEPDGFTLGMGGKLSFGVIVTDRELARQAVNASWVPNLIKKPLKYLLRTDEEINPHKSGTQWRGSNWTIQTSPTTLIDQGTSGLLKSSYIGHAFNFSVLTRLTKSPAGPAFLEGLKGVGLGFLAGALKERAEPDYKKGKVWETQRRELEETTRINNAFGWGPNGPQIFTSLTSRNLVAEYFPALKTVPILKNAYLTAAIGNPWGARNPNAIDAESGGAGITFGILVAVDAKKDIEPYVRLSFNADYVTTANGKQLLQIGKGDEARYVSLPEKYGNYLQGFINLADTGPVAINTPPEDKIVPLEDYMTELAQEYETLKASNPQIAQAESSLREASVTTSTISSQLDNPLLNIATAHAFAHLSKELSATGARLLPKIPNIKTAAAPALSGLQSQFGRLFPAGQSIAFQGGGAVSFADEGAALAGKPLQLLARHAAGFTDNVVKVGAGLSQAAAPVAKAAAPVAKTFAPLATAASWLGKGANLLTVAQIGWEITESGIAARNLAAYDDKNAHNYFPQDAVRAYIVRSENNLGPQYKGKELVGKEFSVENQQDSIDFSAAQIRDKIEADVASGKTDPHKLWREWNDVLASTPIELGLSSQHADAFKLLAATILGREGTIDYYEKKVYGNNPNSVAVPHLKNVYTPTLRDIDLENQYSPETLRAAGIVKQAVFTPHEDPSWHNIGFKTGENGEVLVVNTGRDVNGATVIKTQTSLYTLPYEVTQKGRDAVRDYIAELYDRGEISGVYSWNSSENVQKKRSKAGS